MHFFSPKLHSTSQKNVNGAKWLIQHSLNQPVELPEIARQLNISYHSLRKQFSRSEGLSMKQFYQQHRFDVAKRLLKNRDLTITEIARSLGFSADSNFNRWFKHFGGITPGNFRKE